MRLRVRLQAATVRRLLVNLALTVLVSQLMTLAMYRGLLRPLQLQSSDLLFRLQPDSAAKWSALVTVDDRTISQLRSLGRFFYWPRQMHAQVITNLKAAGARIIVWDVLFDAPGEGDAELAEAMKAAGNVVLAEAYDLSTRLPSTPERSLRFGDTLKQLPTFREAAIGIGHANQLPDTDGTIRATPLLVEISGQDLPSLPLVAAAKFLRRPQVIEAPIADGKMSFVGRQIPVDEAGRMWISYVGDSSKVTNPPTFPTISYLDALNNTFAPDVVRGKLVFVGMAATGYADDYWTPVSRYSKMDGVEIHANAFETIMRPDTFIVPVTPHQTALLIYAAGGLALVCLSALHVLPAIAVVALAGLAYLAVAVVAVDQWNLILDLPFPLINEGLCFLAIVIYRVTFEQAQQRALKGAMSQYLSPDVMEEVVRDPRAIKLGGEKREMTVLFSDIRGFTSLSEQLEPEKLVHILNVYLTRMSDVIFKHQGTVDKYMGDAIMAFWGAPKAQPDHARLACLTALEMVDELNLLNAQFEREGVPRLNMGIGLNTGVMSVGNMGSERRFDYTVMGDAVNLGSRLEGLNKEYGTSVIAAEATLAQAGEAVRARFLDFVAVKGKKEPARVYELLSSRGHWGARDEAALREYDRGLALYQARDFAGALAAFEAGLRLDDGDGASALYVDRCRELLANPPPAEWDGVYVMTHK